MCKENPPVKTTKIFYRFLSFGIVPGKRFARRYSDCKRQIFQRISYSPVFLYNRSR